MSSWKQIFSSFSPFALHSPPTSAPGMTQMVLTSCVKQGGSGTFMPHQTAEMCDCRGRISLHTDRLVVRTYLIWLVDGVKWDPCCSYQGVPDESFIPHLHDQTQVQTINLTWATDRDTEIEIRPSTNIMKKCTNSETSQFTHTSLWVQDTSSVSSRGESKYSLTNGGWIEEMGINILYRS